MADYKYKIRTLFIHNQCERPSKVKLENTISKVCTQRWKVAAIMFLGSHFLYQSFILIKTQMIMIIIILMIS